MASSAAAFGRTRSLIHSVYGDGSMARPTIKPTAGFSATADAEQLHHAMKGLGTNEDALIKVLTRRTNFERQEIVAAYEKLYKKPLRDVICGDTSGSFKTILCELVEDTAYILAKSLFYAMKGLGTNERVLIEVLAPLRNKEMEAIAEAYKRVLKKKGIEDEKRTLLGDVKSDTSGEFQNALVCLMTEQLDEIPDVKLRAIKDNGVQSVVSMELAETDAKTLLAAGASRIGTNEKRMTEVMCRRTPLQLYMANQKYSEIFGKSLLDDLKDETSGDFCSLLITILRYATDRACLIAEWLHDAMSGLGTRDYTLMRLLITRAEIDLEDVKEAYQTMYGKSLKDAIYCDTSGNYRKTLISLLGEDP